MITQSQILRNFRQVLPIHTKSVQKLSHKRERRRKTLRDDAFRPYFIEKHFDWYFSLLSVSRKNIDALGINYTVSRENKTANHFDFARISVRHQKTADIELVVRKEDSTSNRRLSSLNFSLSLSLIVIESKVEKAWKTTKKPPSKRKKSLEFYIFHSSFRILDVHKTTPSLIIFPLGLKIYYRAA